ncbi:hypothetical protein [Ammoniphilus sp. 3BR4]|uniref:hypothetical protein n=1 Tax=Ammoniphilus sp. 3BR4 TaxID=3158265 RepID=UPI003467123F
MNKLDYLFRTSRGNHDRYMERYRRRFNFSINQETYSKKSMHDREKLLFQQEITGYMRANKRRAFRGPVVLHMDFYPSRGNPPSIHQLAKNYLDLLWRPATGLENLILPLKDDRQISILIVNYHIQKQNEIPRIEMQMAPLYDFYEDLRLVEAIRSGDGFPEDDDHSTYDYKEIFDEEDKDPFEQLDQIRENLEGIEDLKDIIGLETFLNLKRMYLVQYQSNWFNLEKLKTFDLIHLFPNDRISSNEFLDTILEQHRNLIISHSFRPLRTAGLPTRMGDTEKFKATIRALLNEFRERYPSLFPLHINLNLTILYVPPSGQEIDLDNLARYIVPLINEALKPPAGVWFAQNNHPRGFPTHTIIQYQIIKIPRKEHDPENGIVRLVFGEYEPFNNCWRNMDRIINSWSDAVF